jgi:hypothetical protein
MKHNFCRLSLKDNPFRCSYILPDGIASKKGFVKDLDKSHRYCSLPVDEELDQKEGDNDTTGLRIKEASVKSKFNKLCFLLCVNVNLMEFSLRRNFP